MNHQEVVHYGWNYLVLILAGLLTGTSAISSHVQSTAEPLQKLLTGLELVQSAPDPHFGKTGELFAFPRCEKTDSALAAAGAVPWCARSNQQPKR